MSTEDPKPVEPTGDPRVDALIDALVCPTCRTIYNAEKTGCADLWHYDNRPLQVVVAPDPASGGIAAYVVDRIEGDRAHVSRLGPVEPAGSTPVSEEPGGHLVSSGEFATAEHDLPREKSRGRAPVSEEPAPPPTPKPFPCYWVAGTEECNGYSRGELDAKIAEAYERATEGWEREWGAQYRDDSWVQATFDDQAAAVEFAAGAIGHRAVSRLVGPWEPAEPDEPPPVKHARGCACGVNDAGDRFTDLICRGQ